MVSRKNIILIFFVFALGLTGRSQQVGRVLDAETGLPIPVVSVINLTDSSYEVTTNTGEFSFTSQGSFSFVAYGYEGLESLAPETSTWTVRLKPDPIVLDRVTVSSFGLNTSYEAYPGPTSIISPKKIARTDPSIITNALNMETGIYIHSGALNTNRITIRGIGARTPFSTNKIRAFYEGIPLTDGIGETTIEDLDMTTLGSIRVLKGPGSSRFGAGLGGVIDIKRPVHASSRFVDLDVGLGSFGLKRLSTTFSDSRSNNDIIVNYNQQFSDGYRDNNEFDRRAAMFAYSHYSDRDQISIIGYFIRQLALIPSSLNEEDFLNDPTKAAFTWKQAQGYEDYFKFLLGATWQHFFSSQLSMKSSIYTNFRDSYEARPFNILRDHVTGLGLRSQLTYRMKNDISFAAGFEYYQDSYGWKTYENLYQNSGGGSVRGDILTDFQETRSFYNVFGEIRIPVSERLSLEGGFNLNQTFYVLQDYYSVDSISQSGSYSFDVIFSPRFAVNYKLNQSISVYALASHGFSPPSLEETLTPEGAPNPDIKPETGWNFELGSKGRILSDRLLFNLSIYSMQIKNLLVARRTAEDQYVGINAGSTIHNGLELGLSNQFIDRGAINLSGFANATFTAYRFEEFVDGENDFSGNKLTGVPANQFTAGIDLSLFRLLYSQVEFQHFGEIPITDDNSVFSDAYSLLNFRVGINKRFWNNLDLNLSYRMNNVLDERYASMLAINASSFGGNAPRYYYPGLPRNHQANMKVRLFF